MVCVSRDGGASARACWYQAGYQATNGKERGWPMAALKIPLRLTRLVSRAKERDRNRFSL